MSHGLCTVRPRRCEILTGRGTYVMPSHWLAIQAQFRRRPSTWCRTTSSHNSTTLSIDGGRRCRSLGGSSPPSHSGARGIELRSGHVRFVVDKEALWLLPLPLIPLITPYSFFSFCSSSGLIKWVKCWPMYSVH